MLETVLTVDLGGSALKACLFDIGGRALGRASEPLLFEEDAAGRSEQQPASWWDALSRVLSGISAGLGGRLGPVSAISVCGFTRTQIFIDAEGRVVRPAIGFRDTRAAGVAIEAAALPEVAAHPEARNLNGFHPLARLLWVMRYEPDLWASVRFVLEPKDYLAFRLTGRAASERVSQDRLISAFEDGAGSLAACLGVDVGILPDILAPWDVVGPVRGDLPEPFSQLAGARVFCGSNDTWAAVAGLGALRPRHAYCISGSSEVLGLLSDKPADAEGLVTLRWGEGLWHIGGPGQNGSNALAWIVDCLDAGKRPFAERLDALLNAPAAGQPLLFHPYLHGERTPFWDGNLRGAFLGLTARHGPGDMVRAVMQGVAFLNRLVLERAEAAAGIRAPELRIAGGGGRNADWNQIRADILGRPVVAASEPELGLIGCLAVARVGLGLDADVSVAAQAISPRPVRFEPDPGARERLNQLYMLFKETHEVVACASHRLAGMG
jgi:xylulokinase